VRGSRKSDLDDASRRMRIGWQEQHILPVRGRLAGLAGVIFANLLSCFSACCCIGWM
jgi:hypothetical protein